MLFPLCVFLNADLRLDLQSGVIGCSEKGREGEYSSEYDH